MHERRFNVFTPRALVQPKPKRYSTRSQKDRGLVYGKESSPITLAGTYAMPNVVPFRDRVENQRKVESAHAGRHDASRKQLQVSGLREM